jgi:hypothetical protein
MTFYPTANEVLTIGFDPMISLPIHFQIQAKIVQLKMPSMMPGFALYQRSSSLDIIQSGIVIQWMLSNFKEYFVSQYFFSVLDLNRISFDEDCVRAASYLYCYVPDLRSYLLGYLTVAEMTAKILTIHLDLVNLTLDSIDKESTFNGYFMGLKKLCISEDAHLAWISQLPRSIRYSVYRNFCLSLLNYDLSTL